MEGHRMLADLGFKELKQDPIYMISYLVCNLPQHLAATRDINRLREVLNHHWFWENSPVFQKEELYSCITQITSSQDALNFLTPFFSYFTEQASAKSPSVLGYTLFPHEPGVTFVGGTIRHISTDTGDSLECSFPPGVIEPPKEVLWDYVKICHRAFLSTSAFLQGVPDSTIFEWYSDYWKQSGLQSILDSIDRYYDSCYFHLAHRAMELSWQIDEVLKKAIASQSTSNIS